LEQFLEYCAGEKLPVDFVSFHPYPTDFALDLARLYTFLQIELNSR
jgi:hypothetical protein